MINIESIAFQVWTQPMRDKVTLRLDNQDSFSDIDKKKSVSV